MGNSQEERNKKSAFIISLCEFVKKPANFTGFGMLDITFLISLDDLELLQLFFKEIGSFKQLTYLPSSIKSLQVLDYLFQVLPDSFMDLTTKYESWYSINNINILKRLEELSPNLGLELIPKYKGFLSDQVINYVLDKPKIYRIGNCGTFSQTKLMVVGCYYYSNEQFKLLVKFVSHHLEQSQENRVEFIKLDSRISAKLIHHLSSEEFKEYSNRIIYPKYYLDYLLGNYESSVNAIISKHIYSNKEKDELFGLINLAIKKFDFNYLNLLLKEILSNIQQQPVNPILKVLIKNIILLSYRKGYFRIIEFIHLNYPSILSGSSRNQSRVFTLRS